MVGVAKGLVLNEAHDELLNVLADAEVMARVHNLAHELAIADIREATELAVRTRHAHAEMIAPSVDGGIQQELGNLLESEKLVRRALTAFGRWKRDQMTMGKIRHLRGEAERMDLKLVLPALEAALTSDQVILAEFLSQTNMGSD